MALAHVERLDHLGLIASLIKDVGLIDMIDTRLVPDDQEEITPGEAMAGMILNGLGFANRPLSLTSQFFANKPLDLLCREGVRAESFNRFKLGRTLDEVVNGWRTPAKYTGYAMPQPARVRADAQVIWDETR